MSKFSLPLDSETTGLRVTQIPEVPCPEVKKLIQISL